MIASLSSVTDPSRFGGKAVQLGHALRAGLPVPGGVALAHDAGDDLEALARAIAAEVPLARGVAVRSSAVGEDGERASFAGQHATRLGVRSVPGLVQALAEVRASAVTEAALAYRRRLGVGDAPRMGIVVQALVHADVAGVLFSQHPLTGADERVVEGTYGLGEAVVAGLVTPDSFRMARGGAVLEQVLGEKDLMIAYDPEGDGTVEREVEADRVEAFCLCARRLAQLDALTARCEAVFPGTQDLEWAFEADTLFLLQRRAITRVSR